MSQKQLSFAK
ncbi:unnamed protein product, partial [Vitis vinifera]